MITLQSDTEACLKLVSMTGSQNKEKVLAKK